MKKILNILFYTLLPFTIFSQGRIAEIWTQPAVFKADEQVSWFFDLTGTPLQGETEGVYMWSWFPSEPDAGNWSTPSDFAKLIQVEGNIWKLVLVPTEYYGLPANEIVAFYGLLKNKDGSKVTDAFAPDQTPRNDIQIYSLAEIKGTKIIEHYPVNFVKDRPLSFLFNANNTWSDCETQGIQGKLASAPNVHMHSGVNFWDIQVQNNAENLSKTELTHLGEGIYRMDIVLEDYFNLPDDYEVNNINIVLANDNWSYKGLNITCADFLIIAPDIPEVIPPELTFFPQKISKKDILCITRKNNEPYVTQLNYTIVAGTKEITGTFTKNSEGMQTFVNLVNELKDIESLTTIRVIIKDNTGRTVSSTDIPLINLKK